MNAHDALTRAAEICRAFFHDDLSDALLAILASQPRHDALRVLQDAVQYAVNRLDHDPRGPQQVQVSGDLAVALAYSKSLQNDTQQIAGDGGSTNGSRMTPKQLDALRMLNDAFESHDGRPVEQAIITMTEYRLLYEALAGESVGDRIAQDILAPSPSGNEEIR